jgi:citrate lyase subunit beta/citryl-CoA lyase
MPTLRRSALFTPADDPGMMRTATESPADALIFDLEDAVPADHLPEARENIRRVLTDIGDDVEAGVRINAVDTDLWLDDVRAAVAAGIDAVLIPKVESPAELSEVTDALAASTDAPPVVRFAIETPTGLLNASTIGARAASLPLVAGISFGLADYCRALGAPGPTESIRDRLAFRIGSVAAAHSLGAFASTHLDVDDEAGLRRVAASSRDMGFDGMSAIHPAQLPVINDVFTPDADAVRRARQLMEAYEAADSDSIRVDGEFLDEATVAHHRTLIERYEAVHADEP